METNSDSLLVAEMEQLEKLKAAPPLPDQTEGIGAYTLRFPKYEPEKVAPTGWGETIAAFYRRNDPLYNYAKNISDSINSLAELHEKDRQPFDPMPLLPNHPPHMWPYLSTSVTKGEFYRKAATLEIDDEDQKSLNAAPWYYTLGAGAVTGVGNPFYAMGFQSVGGLNLLKAGIKSAVAGATAGVVSELATEGVLLSTQEQREVSESLYNIGISGIMGGIFGGVGGAIKSARYPIMRQMLESQLDGGVAHFKMEKSGAVKGFNLYDKAGTLIDTIDLHNEQLLGLNVKGEYSAASPFIWFAGKATQNPVIKVLTSKSAVASRFINGWLEHSMDIVGNVVHGENLPHAVQTKIRAWDQKIVQANRIVVHGYQEYLGQVPGFNIKNIMSSFFKPPEGFLTFGQYLQQLYYPIVTGKVHENALIQRISKALEKEIFETNTQALVDVGKLPLGIKPRAAFGHISRLYDVPYMKANATKVKDFFFEQFKDTQNKILEAKGQLDALADNVATIKIQLEKAKNSTQKKILKKKLRSAQALHSREDKRLYNLMESGHFDTIDEAMVVGERGMPPEDRAKLTSLRKPIKQMKSKIKDAEAKVRTSKLEKQSKEIIEANKKELAKAKKALQDYREELLRERDLGNIPANYFKGNFLRKPNKGTLSFRPILDDVQLRVNAEDTFNQITGLSEASFVDKMLGFSGGGTGEGFLKERKLLINDEKLYNSGIMITDIRKNIQAATSRTARVVEIAKYMQANGLEIEGQSYLKSLAQAIQADYSILELKQAEKYRRLKENATGDELKKIERKETKASTKLKDEQKDVQDTIADSFMRIAGTKQVRMEKLLRVARFSNDWANATQLGALATLMLQDIVAPIFRSGALNWAATGPINFIGNLLTLNGNNKLLREQAADLNLGIQKELAFLSQGFNVSSDVDLPLNGFEQFTRKLPTAMGLISGSTALSDLAERWATTATLSKRIRNMYELLDGTISKNDAIKLRAIGLGDVEIAKHLTSYIDKHGDVFAGGARYANWNAWTEGLTDPTEIAKAQAARVHLQNAISKEVKSGTFSGANPASYPAGLPMNSITSAILPYMGWIFNAQANYMIPLFQRFDPDKVLGMFAMVSMASLSNPLREIAEGKEPNLDPEHLLKVGILGSGFVGVLGDVFNKINVAGKIFPDAIVDRYERKGLELFSPLTGLLNTGAKTAGMLANLEFNKRDIENAIFAIPIMRAIEFRRIVKQMVDSLDIPETRRDAANE